MMDFVNGKDYFPYMKWKIKMFESTKQIWEIPRNHDHRWETLFVAVELPFLMGRMEDDQDPTDPVGG